MSLADQVAVFYRSLTETHARVYVQWPEVRGGDAWSIHGWIRGPFCDGVRTLPHQVSLRDEGSGPTLLAAAEVVDPAFWTPDLPARYQVHVESHRDGKPVEALDRWLGFRPLEVRGRHLRMAGKRWVLRGLYKHEPTVQQLAECRENRAALVVQSPTDELLDAASSQGVLVVIDVPRDGMVDAVRNFSRWPAVAMFALPADSNNLDEIRNLGINALLAQWAASEQVATSKAAALLCEASDVLRFSRICEASTLPMIAVRRLNGSSSIVEARSACDLLQRDLVRFGDFAGYVV